MFAHGFVYRKNEETGETEKIGKALGNIVEPMEVITKFSAEAFLELLDLRLLVETELAGRVAVAPPAMPGSSIVGFSRDGGVNSGP